MQQGSYESYNHTCYMQDRGSGHKGNGVLRPIHLDDVEGYRSRDVDHYQNPKFGVGTSLADTRQDRHCATEVCIILPNLPGGMTEYNIASSLQWRATQSPIWRERCCWGQNWIARASFSYTRPKRAGGRTGGNFCTVIRSE